MKIYNFKVEGQHIYCTNIAPTITDSVNYVYAKFSFNRDWKRLSKTVTFTNKEVVKLMVLDDNNVCIIPWECLQEKGQLVVYIEGRNTESKLVISTKMCNTLLVKESDKTIGGSQPKPPTPDIISQLTELINKKQNRLVAGDNIELIDDEETMTTIINSSGGGGSVEEDIKVMGVTVGNLKDGDIIEKGSNLTQVLRKALQKIIHPTYIKPTLSLSTDKTLLFEKDTEYTVKIMSKFSKNDGGNALSTVWKLNNITDSTEVSPTNKTYTINDSTTIKCDVTYADGVIKKNNFGEDDPIGRILSGTISSSLIFEGVYPFYYMSGKVFDYTKAIKDISKKGNKTYSYTCHDERCYIAYPKIYGELKQIIDMNKFDSTKTFSKSEISINGIEYYLYENNQSTITNFDFTFNF